MNDELNAIFTAFLKAIISGLDDLGEMILIIFNTPLLRFWLWLTIFALIIILGLYADTHPSLNNGEW